MASRGRGLGEGEGEALVQLQGSRPGQKPGQRPGKPGQRPGKRGQEPQQGDEDQAKTSQAKGKGAKETRLDQDPSGETALREATAEEREAWGRINDRDVAKSLKEAWDKIPQTYRLMVTQYFRDLSDPEPVKSGK